MDRNELIQALRDLDSQVTSPFDLIVIGGAAMILHFAAPRATRDIDALVLQGDIAELRRAIQFVAHARGLPENWLSDAAKGFAGILPSDFQTRLSSFDFGLKHLRIYFLGRPEQAAMKIIALREQDLEDLEILLPQMSESEKQVLIQIAHHVARFRQDWAQKLQYFMQEQGWWSD
ncbi:MAG: hypothetical protein HZC40_12230 [Chloroflexi bacterium]|nr:hypothetical protein [Chloroflexota bacterium]